MHARVAAQRLVQELVTVDSRHVDVGKHELAFSRAYKPQSLLGIRGRNCLIAEASDLVRQHLELRRVVIQNARNQGSLWRGDFQCFCDQLSHARKRWQIVCHRNSKVAECFLLEQSAWPSLSPRESAP